MIQRENRTEPEIPCLKRRDFRPRQAGFRLYKVRKPLYPMPAWIGSFDRKMGKLKESQDWQEIYECDTMCGTIRNYTERKTQARKREEANMEMIWNSACVAWDWVMEHLLYINLIFSIIIVFFQRRDPRTVWTWLLALYFVPVFGIAFYLLFGQDLKKAVCSA